MKINVIALGKIKETALQQLINEYIKRISKYSEINIIEVKEQLINQNASEAQINIALENEGKSILKHINEKEFVFVLDPKGKTLDSPALSKEIEKAFVLGQSNISFVIGSSYGLSKEVKERANSVLSFSPLTFPHQLFRLLLLEQIFRSFKISKNEVYHK